MENSLAVIYSVFNGEELLKSSIMNIRPFADRIIVVWQDVSNHGNLNEYLYMKLLSLQRHLNIELVKYVPNLGLHPKKNELLKRQLGIDTASDCSHILLMDVDHFYDPEQFAKAKELIYREDYDSSATKMYTYYKYFDCRLEKIEDYYCPFIHKQPSKILFNKYPIRVDPALSINPTNKFKEFAPEELIMHHYSWVRKDIASKINNAASKCNWIGKERELEKEYNEHNYGNMLSYYKLRTIKVSVGENIVTFFD